MKIDFNRVAKALDEVEPIEQFADIMREIEAHG
jgi:hypothetical protein